MTAALKAKGGMSEDGFYVLANAMPQMVWSTLPDGYHDYYNARWYEFTGMLAGSTDGEAWNGMFHPDDQDRAWALWRHSLTTGDQYEIEYRLRNANGDYRWVLGRALPVRDADGTITRWFGTCTDIHDQKLALEQREIISHELSHRIKNIFSVIGGLVGLVTRDRPEFREVADELRDRVIALGRAHDFVRPHSAASAPAAIHSGLQGMLEQLLAPYQIEDRDRIVVSGDNPDIDDRSATPLALVFHELATNAAKYGALSALDGVIRIRIACRDGMVRIDWQESGGPVVAKPGHEGFGTRLMELSVVRQLDGKITRQWDSAGLSVVLSVPLLSMRRQAG